MPGAAECRHAGRREHERRRGEGQAVGANARGLKRRGQSLGQRKRPEPPQRLIGQAPCQLFLGRLRASRRGRAARSRPSRGCVRCRTARRRRRASYSRSVRRPVQGSRPRTGRGSSDRAAGSRRDGEDTHAPGHRLAQRLGARREVGTATAPARGPDRRRRRKVDLRRRRIVQVDLDTSSSCPRAQARAVRRRCCRVSA